MKPVHVPTIPTITHLRETIFFVLRWSDPSENLKDLCSL